MEPCSATFSLLDAPLTLADLAGHLATRKNFVLHPCRERAMRALQMVAGPYGYEVTFHAAEEMVLLRYRHSRQPCNCDEPIAHLSATQQLKLSCRR